MLKLSIFKLNGGFEAQHASDLTLLDTEALQRYNADKVLLDYWSKGWHDDGLKFFGGEGYNLLLNYFDGDATKFHVVANDEFCEQVYVIHV